MTARHVIQDNMDSSGLDSGPIFAIQTFPDRTFALRPLKNSDLHPGFDLALSETYVPQQAIDKPTVPLTLCLEELDVKDPVCSFAVFAYDQTYADENDGASIYKFEGNILNEYTPNFPKIKFAVGFSIGEVSTIF